MTGANWTVERDEALRKLVKCGLTGAQIAKELSVSRCAVIGRMRRLGVKSLNPPRKLSEVERALRESKSVSVADNRKKQVRGGTVNVTRLSCGKDALPTWESASSAPEPRNLSLMDLEWRDCRWPVKNPPRGEEHLFCGHPTVVGARYCAHHRLISAGLHRIGEAA